MSQIYIVVGSTGEYSDRQEWNVCAYRDEAKADTHIHNAQLRAIELEHTKQDRYHELPENSVNEFDPNMEMDYTGTEYLKATCELVD